MIKPLSIALDIWERYDQNFMSEAELQED
jgi:hypothetical protein